MKLRSVAVALVTAGLVAAGGTPAGAGSTGDVRRFALADAGAVVTTLGQAQPRTRFEIATPHRWDTAGLDMTLAWTASTTVPPGSALVVEVNDRPSGAAALAPGPGTLRVRETALPLGEPRIVVEIRAVFGSFAQLRPSGETTAFVRIDDGSAIVLTGKTGPPPRASDLPGALVERAGDIVPPLVVALPASPSAEAIEAAGVIAGAVAIQTGFPGTPVRCVVVTGAAELAGTPGALVRIDEGGGGDSIEVRRRAGGEAELTVRGTGRALVDAAWSVAGPPSPPRPARVFRFAPRAMQGLAPLRTELSFRVPTDRVVESARLRVELGFDVPGGGRVSFRANGRSIGAAALPSTGDGRTAVEFDLRRTDVRPGDNRIDVLVTADRPAGAFVEVLAGSHIDVRSRERVEPGLEFWPFLSAGDSRWTNTVVSLPRDPSAEESGAVLAMLAEVARWTGRPTRAAVVFDVHQRATLVSHDVVALVRAPHDATAPGLPAMQPGMLAVARHGAHAILVAVGPAALSPLAGGYFAGRVRGATAIVDERAGVRTLTPAAREPGAGRRWWLPLGSIVAVIAVAFVVGMRRVLRRVAPTAEEAPWDALETIPIRPVHPAPHAESLDPDAALADWLDLKR